MAKINWLELVLENEEKVLDGIKEAHEMACGGNNGNEYTAEINSDGNISIREYTSSGSQSEATWKGNAIELVRIKAIDPMEGDTFDWFPEDDPTLTATEKASFLLWCEENAETASDPCLLYNWNPEVWERWEANYTEEYLVNYAEEYVHNAWDWLVEDLRRDQR